MARKARKITNKPPKIASRFLISRPKASRQMPALRLASDSGAAVVVDAVIERQLPLAVADAWVDVAVQHVDDHIQRRYGEGIDDRHRHDQAVIALDDALHVVLADPGDAEERLDDEWA